MGIVRKTSFSLVPADISACSLWSSSAMAMLCTELDTDKIQVLGHWWSDEMLWYLHMQAYPLVSTFAAAMLLHGTFHFIPNPATQAAAT